MISGVSVIQRGPRRVERTLSKRPVLHHSAIVETSSALHLSCGFSRIAPVSSLSSWCGFGSLWTPSRDVIGIPNPLDFADGKRSTHARLLSFLIQQGGNLRIGVSRRQLPHALDHLRARLAFFPRHLVAWDNQVGESLSLPANSDINDIAPFGERHVLDQPPQQLFPLGKGRR